MPSIIKQRVTLSIAALGLSGKKENKFGIVTGIWCLSLVLAKTLKLK